MLCARQRCYSTFSCLIPRMYCVHAVTPSSIIARFGDVGKRLALRALYGIFDGRPVVPSHVAWFHYHRLRLAVVWLWGEYGNYISGECVALALCVRAPLVVLVFDTAMPVPLTGTLTRAWAP